MNSILKTLLSGLPPILQYMVVIAVAMLILYVALVLTRKIGEHRGSTRVTYDDPEKNDKSVPDLFASTAFRRKKKKNKDGEA